MANSPAEIHKAIKKIKLIGLILVIFTGITVWLSTVELPTHSMNIALGMVVAAFKASLVMLIFMHLNHESPLVYKILAFTVAFVLALVILTLFASSDPLVFHGLYESNT